MSEVVDSVSTLMQNVLDGIVGVFEDASVSLPAKQYLAMGEVAHDCEQLTVSLLQMYLGSPGAQAETPQRCDAPRTVVLQIQIARCLPSPEARSITPSAAATTAMTIVQARDAWLLMDAATGAVDDFLGVLADVSPTNPSGGFQAVALNLIVAVP